MHCLHSAWAQLKIWAANDFMAGMCGFGSASVACLSLSAKQSASRLKGEKALKRIALAAGSVRGLVFSPSSSIAQQRDPGRPRQQLLRGSTFAHGLFVVLELGVFTKGFARAERFHSREASCVARCTHRCITATTAASRAPASRAFTLGNQHQKPIGPAA